MNPLHAFGDALRAGLGLIPLSAVRGGLIIFLLGLMAWVTMLPNSATTPQGKSKTPLSENLKVWAWLALFLQVLVYATF